MEMKNQGGRGSCIVSGRGLTVTKLSALSFQLQGARYLHGSPAGKGECESPRNKH